MVNFIALYRGRTLGDAQLVAVTSDPDLVSELAGRLIDQPETPPDPIIGALSRGRRVALALVRKEARNEAGK